MSAKNLVIVESPAKAKTIQGYLGKDFVVKSSFGHVRDLPAKKMSVDIEHDFAPQYQVSSDKKKVVTELKKAIGADTIVWLATDEDREGEAIAWHLSEVLKLAPAKTRRIVFHEITKTAIQNAINSPRDIDKHLVDAQQARRVLDRLVGYELSPVLWRKVRPGLSAGRVQSVAVRLVVEREREIAKHASKSSYKISALLTGSNKTEFVATREKNPSTKDEARAILEQLAAHKPVITSIDQSDGVRNPSPPFTTSTLQQEASQRLGMSVKQTMRLAQKLYETGAITYMRTDSFALSDDSRAAATAFITATHGAEYHQHRTFSTKSKGAQEAHEAIRPTNPQTISASSDPKEQKLYGLIRGRFLASQMAPARIKKTQFVISAGTEQLVAKGEVVVFDGWLKEYPFVSSKDTLLPQLGTGETLNLINATAQETLSRPPARYSEALLVKKLEEMGIGRPSTYAPTISTIQDRGYITREPAPTSEVTLQSLMLKNGSITEEENIKTIGGEKRKLMPTDTALVVSDFLVKHFETIVDFDFTAKVEQEFDEIAEGADSWNRMIKDFYTEFHPTIEAAAKVSRQEASQAREIGTDPKSGKPIVARYGRFGPMLQRGSAEDEEKPQFAPLPPNATIDSVTLEQALTMFQLPRTLGQSDGVDIKANIGRFGPYVQKNKTYASIPKDEDVFTLTFDRALELIAEKEAAAQKMILADLGDGISVRTGRFGPYVTNGKVNAKIPKGTEPDAVTKEVALELLKKKS